LLRRAMQMSALGSLSDTKARALKVCALALLALAAVAASIEAAPGLAGMLGAVLALLMLAIAVIDARWLIIPDQLVAAGLGLGLINAAVIAPQEMWQAAGVALLRGAVLALLFYVLRTLYRRLRGRQGIGLGDVKLAAVAGAWLDWLTMPIAIEIAALAALGVIGIRYYAAGRQLHAALKFPFGLFLAPSIWACWLLEATLLAPR
jgi:leader peptidase (prepilin peptidase)/N-methyltransferase